MCIYFIDPDDDEFKDIMKNARRKLEVPIPAAVPCKTQREKNSEKQCETKYACTVEADESMRGSAWMDLFTSIMKIIWQEKGINSLMHYNLVHKFIPMPEAIEITRS